MKLRHVWSAAAVLVALAIGCRHLSTKAAPENPAVLERASRDKFDDEIEAHSRALFKEGREIFRYDTFKSEDFWGGKLRLHEAIASQEHGGRGAGLTPKQALGVGLKVDREKLPKILLEALRGGAVSLENPKTTLELLKANAVVGITGFFEDPGDRLRLTSVGIQCALCHSTVDDSFMKGIGHRLDGWPNRDLNVGEIVAMAPTLKPFEDLLKLDDATIRKVLKSWGPGKYDAELDKDGRGVRTDGKSAATVLPAAFGLAGMNLHTYNGWGGVPYWNAYVATTQMHGKGTFFDPRLKNPEQYPTGAPAGLWNIREKPDWVTSKLPALHYYQLSIPAPRPDKDTYNEEAARRGEGIFMEKARCATCHVPPLFSEPGWPMHTADEIGIDDFQASRSPDKKFYRTTPLRGLFVRMKGGFYHDGRFATLEDVVAHYEKVLGLGLAQQEKADLVEFLKSL